MNIEDAIDYCYKHKDRYIIENFDTLDEGQRAFDCLIVILEDKTITPEELKDYGMEY
jgi:hypothetical protein